MVRMAMRVADAATVAIVAHLARQVLLEGGRGALNVVFCFLLPQYLTVLRLALASNRVPDLKTRTTLVHSI